MIMNKMKLVSIFALIALAFTFHSAQARHCGKIMGKEIKTYGGLSCSKAKSVYKAFNKGNTPKGWTCGQSVGGCGKGNYGFTFPTTR